MNKDGGDMPERKELKKRARATLKRHYFLLVVLCLISSAVGLEYRAELMGFGLSNGSRPEDVVESGTTSTSGGVLGVWEMLVGGDMTGGADLARERIWEMRGREEVRIGSVSLGRTRGVLASAVNLLSSGSVLVRIYAAIRNVVRAKTAATAIFVILTLLAYLAAISMAVTALYVVFRRVILEARIYEKVPLQRFLFLLRTRKWLQAVRTILYTTLLMFLWALTVAGIFVKYFSYRMVPYIIAENPSLRAREAVDLSRRLMDGHKWECCKLEATFLLWQVLSFATAGIVGIFFANPYHAAAMAEYYASLRQQAKEKKLEGTELLWDDFLYEKAEPEILRAAYRDVEEPVELPRSEGARGFLADNFGLVLRADPEEKRYEETVERNARYEREKLSIEGLAYPDRLSPFVAPPSGLTRRLESIRQITELHPVRHYTLTTLVLMFFLFSGTGWVWEVALHLIETGEFVNRGTMHGPWLPIYGVGATLILTFLYRFRSKPWLEFLLTVALCGVVEYGTAYILEHLFNGTKWWDYSGYFLNLHGRVCAEGLLAFGIGGLMAVYVACPLIDNNLRRLSQKRCAAAAAALAVLFLADGAYSLRHPNTGEGITDIAQVDQFRSLSSAARSFSNAFFSIRDT